MTEAGWYSANSGSVKAAASGSERGWIDDYRYKKYENSQGYDIVFVARGATGEVKMQEVLAVMKNQLGSIMLPQQADAARTEENAR